MDNDKRLQIYSGCMTEIKDRIALIDFHLAGWRSSSEASRFVVENAALQLRKIYELVGFASLSADLDRYRNIKKRFEKEWNFAAIINQLSKLNPEFLPKPVRRTVSSVKGVNWHFEERPDAYLNAADLVCRHGFLGNYLHANNPFGPSPDYVVVCRRIDTWVREIGSLLSQHRYVIGPNQEGYIIELNGHDTAVTALKYELKRS